MVGSNCQMKFVQRVTEGPLRFCQIKDIADFLLSLNTTRMTKQLAFLADAAGLVPGCFLAGLLKAVLGSYAFTVFLALPLVLAPGVPKFSDSPKFSPLC